MINPQSRPRAVITGASSGIGAAYADRLAARGHDLIIVARRTDRLAALAAEITGKHGVAVEIITADLSSAPDLARVETLLRDRDDIDLLVNNAGEGGLGRSATLDVAVLERVITLNVVALTRLSHAALAAFRRRGAGGLINIGSVIALSPSPTAAAYSGSKAFVLNFTRSLQLEYADSGIQIQLIQPGPIHTEFFAAAGVSDSIFPAEYFLTVDQLVDAALSGFDQGERVTTPSLPDLATWEVLERAREQFMADTRSGQVAARYS